MKTKTNEPALSYLVQFIPKDEKHTLKLMENI
jgi:hypothetical protein